MDPKFFINNLKTANQFFPNKLDATKYIFYIYGFIKKEIELLIKFKYGLLKVRSRDNSNSDSFILEQVFMQDCYDVSRFTDVVSVNTIMEKMNWDSIDFLKIDIEGYEEVLLK